MEAEANESLYPWAEAKKDEREMGLCSQLAT